MVILETEKKGMTSRTQVRRPLLHYVRLHYVEFVDCRLCNDSFRWRWYILWWLPGKETKPALCWNPSAVYHNDLHVPPSHVLYVGPLPRHGLRRSQPRVFSTQQVRGQGC